MKTQPAKRVKKPSGIYFLAAVVSLYCLLFLFSAEGAKASLIASTAIFAKLLPIMLVVIVLLGLFSHLFNARGYAKRLSTKSGMRAYAIAIAGGILSHGPAFIWYPMLGEMRDHGVKEGLLVAFLYVRAIKLPWLPVMVDYFGWEFTLLLSLYLIVAALCQGWLMERFTKV